MEEKMLTVFRKEIKYIIPAEQFLHMEKQLDCIMQRDPYGNNGTYQIRSQYFDSVNDQDLQDNLSGVMEKRKIRTRIYGLQDQTVKLEYKCKSGNDSVKHSLLISRQEAEEMEKHNYHFLIRRPEELASFLYTKMMRGAYRPKTIILYSRTAFLYPVSDVRITFDHHISSSVNPHGLFREKIALTPVLPQDMGILEVKYNDFLPSVLKQVIRQADRSADAYSKYSSARLNWI